MLDCDSERRLKKLLFAIFAILRMVYLICSRNGEIIQSDAVINLDYCTILFSFHGLISSFHATLAEDNLKSRKSYFTTVATSTELRIQPVKRVTGTGFSIFFKCVLQKLK